MFLGENGRKLYDLLLMKTKELGRAPTFEEVREDDRLPHPNSYAFYFGEFAEAVKQACSELHLEIPGKKPKVQKAIEPLSPERQAQLEEMRVWHDRMIENSLAPMRFLKQQAEKERQKAARIYQREKSRKAAELDRATEPSEAVETAMASEPKKAEISMEEKEGVAMGMEGTQLNREEMLAEIAALAKENRRLPDLKSMGNLGGKLRYTMHSYVNAIAGGDVEATKQAILDFLWMKEDENGELHGRRGRKPRAATEVAGANASTAETKPTEEPQAAAEAQPVTPEKVVEAAAKAEIPATDEPLTIEIQIKLAITINGKECKVQIVQ